MSIKLPKYLRELSEIDLSFGHLDYEWVSHDNGMLNAWFGTRNVDYTPHLYPFAQDGSGGMFCLWSEAETNDFSDAPVVYLDSEGERSAVATQFVPFLNLLVSGFILYSLVFNGEFYHFSEGIQDDPEGLKEVNAQHAAFSQWLQNHDILYNIEPTEIISAACEAYIQFPAWVDAQTANH